FAIYEADKSSYATALKELAKLKGIGPATASLLLSVYDEENVPFFSDELFRWVCWDEQAGWKRKIKYDMKEYGMLWEGVERLREKLGSKVKAVDLEKVAYVCGRLGADKKLADDLYTRITAEKGERETPQTGKLMAAADSKAREKGEQGNEKETEKESEKGHQGQSAPKRKHKAAAVPNESQTNAESIKNVRIPVYGVFKGLFRKLELWCMPAFRHVTACPKGKVAGCLSLEVGKESTNGLPIDSFPNNIAINRPNLGTEGGPRNNVILQPQSHKAKEISLVSAQPFDASSMKVVPRRGKDKQAAADDLGRGTSIYYLTSSSSADVFPYLKLKSVAYPSSHSQSILRRIVGLQRLSPFSLVMENPPPPPYTPIDPLTPPPPAFDSSFEPNMTILPTMPSLRGGYIRPVDEDTAPGSSSAAHYFDERPFTFIPPSTLISYNLPLSPYTTREDLRLPVHFEAWRARDVVEQDWATFINYILAELHVEPDGKAQESKASVVAEDWRESRRKIEAVIAEWYEGFFGPRRIRITPEFSLGTSARTSSPSPSYRTIQTAVPFPAPNPAPPPGMAVPSHVNHQTLAHSMQYMGRFPPGTAMGHSPRFPFPPGQGPPIPFAAQSQLGPSTQLNISGRNGNRSCLLGEQRDANGKFSAENTYDYHNHHAHHGHHHRHHRHGNGPLSSRCSRPVGPSLSSPSSSYSSHRGRHQHHGGTRPDRHRGRSESTSSSSSSSSSSSISSISSGDLEGADADDIQQSLAAFCLDPTKKDHIHTAIRQLHSELRSHRRGDQRGRKEQSREVRTEIRNQKRAIRNEVRSLVKEAKAMRRSKKREHKAEKRCKKAQLKAQNAGLNSGTWGWRQRGGSSARGANDGQSRSFGPANVNLGTGGRALPRQSQGVLTEHDIGRDTAKERRANGLAIQLEREAEERERKLEAEVRGREKEAEERERHLAIQAEERERQLARQAEKQETQLARQAEERERQAEERERRLDRQAAERERQAEERERQLELQQEARDLQLEKSESQRAKQLERAAEQRAKQEDQRVRELAKAAERREKEVAKLREQADARTRHLQQEAESFRSDPNGSLGSRARTLGDRARTLSINNAEATARALTARTSELGRTVSQSAEERARGLGVREEEFGRSMEAMGEELGRGMEEWGLG
ncbi:MAG: hypothetical protein Q9187_007551, partial [Circinaria calcarea]